MKQFESGSQTLTKDIFECVELARVVVGGRKSQKIILKSFLLTGGGKMVQKSLPTKFFYDFKISGRRESILKNNTNFHVNLMPLMTDFGTFFACHTQSNGTF